MKPGYVYILGTRPGGAIYVGVTGNLAKRVAEHKSGLVAGHTKRYRIDKLVHFEAFDDIRDALQREKNVKHWSRAYKTRLILQSNPTWRDLYADYGLGWHVPKRDGRDKPGHDVEGPQIYTGKLSCLRAGISTRFSRSMASARAMRRRVECGMITSSI